MRTLEDVTSGMEVFDTRVAPDSPVAGQPLGDADLPDGSLVISGAGGERTATSGTRLEGGRRYIVAAGPAAAETVVSVSRGE